MLLTRSVSSLARAARYWEEDIVGALCKKKMVPVTLAASFGWTLENSGEPPKI
jgi:hypothetical protein